MKCIKCSNSISQQRLKVLPSTKVCVNCSTVEAVGCVDICYHKTGNTIQVMDKESAAKINKLSQRRKTKRRKLKQEGIKKIEDFALSKDEVKNIFDILDAEFEDL